MKHLLTLIQLGLLCFACGSDSDAIQTLTRIEITSSNGNRIDLILEETITLAVNGFDQNDMPIDITSDITWSSNNSNVIVENTGLVRPQQIGESLVKAVVDGIEADFPVKVWNSSEPRTDIFVSDVGENRNGPHQILRYYEDGDFAGVYISSELSNPQDIVFLEDQNVVLVSNLRGNDINKYDIETGNFIEAFAENLAGPTRIDIGPDGLLYAILWNGGPVKRYNLDGTFVDDFTDISINEAIGIDWDSNGNLYVSSFNESGSNGLVYKFDDKGVSQGLFVDEPNLRGPTDIWFDDNDNLYVNDWEGNSVRKYDSNGVFVEVFITGLSQPEGIAFLDDGSLIFGASGTSKIPRYNASGTFIEDLVISGSGDLVTPNAVILRKVNQE